MTDQLYQQKEVELIVKNGTGTISIELDPLESLILK